MKKYSEITFHNFLRSKKYPISDHLTMTQLSEKDQLGASSVTSSRSQKSRSQLFSHQTSNPTSPTRRRGPRHRYRPAFLRHLRRGGGEGDPSSSGSGRTRVAPGLDYLRYRPPLPKCSACTGVIRWSFNVLPAGPYQPSRRDYLFPQGWSFSWGMAAVPMSASVDSTRP
jgi:hypothetical protein